jgi:hypothetical protein
VEGDSLVVDVTGQREETWLDRAGDFHSDIHVVERYTPASPDLLYEATIEDLNVHAAVEDQFPLYRRMEKNVQLLGSSVPFTEELLYGNRQPNGTSNEVSTVDVGAVSRSSRAWCWYLSRSRANSRRQRFRQARRRRPGRPDAVGRPRSAGRVERRHRHAAPASNGLQARMC